MGDDNGQELTARQERFLVALLSQATIREAAASAEVPETTAWNWLRDPGFKGRYREARAEVMAHAIARLQKTATRAVDTLSAVLADATAPPASRVSAARVILELGLRAVEHEALEARIEALERESKQIPGWHAQPGWQQRHE